VVNWPKSREFFSRSANLYSRISLGMRINDITAGFRAYRRAVLEKIKLGNVASAGYCFQIDLSVRTVEAGFTAVEVPITFTDRTIGESKMTGDVVREALIRVTKWGLRRRAGQIRRLFRR
jgi:dolichol-phosphate mannosyltransferase